MSKNSAAVGAGGASVLKEDSFVHRRTLFRAIWESAAQLGSDKEGAEEQTIKRKVIETLRLDEMDKTAGRKKKQRIKNLRSVCNRILDFCDRQEKEDQNTLAIEENKLKNSDGISTKTKRSKNVNTPKNVRHITEDKSDGKPRQKSPQRLEKVPEESMNSSRKTSTSTGRKRKLKKTFSYNGRRRVVNKKKLPIKDTSDLETGSGPLIKKPKSFSPH